MSIPGEKINVMIMRDNGQVRSVRMRRSLLVWCVVLCLIMPLIAGFSLWFAVNFWQEHDVLVEKVRRLEQDNQIARAKVERLSNLEQLLQRNTALENAVVANVGRMAEPKVDSKVDAKTVQESGASPEEDEKAATLQEGPGHNEFPAINTGYIVADNINVRLIQGNKLRVSLDLRNPDTRKVISGVVSCSLTTESGETVPLELKPNDAGDFRIARLKRAVFLVPLAGQIKAANGQVIIEVKSDAGDLVYRNVFPVER